MSSVTPNIGLILPDGSENVSRQVINENYTKIDTAFANVGNSTMREVPFNIPTSAWTLSNGAYTAEFTTAYVTASSKEIGTYTNSLRQYAKADIDMAKKSGGGGMVFTTTTAPTGTISGSLYIWDNDDGKVPIVVEGTVIPISNGGTGGNDLSTAKSNLGITAMENQISANTQAIENLGTWVNDGEVTGANVITIPNTWQEVNIIVSIDNNIQRMFDFHIVRGSFPVGTYIYRNGYYDTNGNYAYVAITFDFKSSLTVDISMYTVTLTGTDYKSTSLMRVMHKNKVA